MRFRQRTESRNPPNICGEARSQIGRQEFPPPAPWTNGRPPSQDVRTCPTGHWVQQTPTVRTPGVTSSRIQRANSGTSTAFAIVSGNVLVASWPACDEKNRSTCDSSPEDSVALASVHPRHSGPSRLNLQATCDTYTVSLLTSGRYNKCSVGCILWIHRVDGMNGKIGAWLALYLSTSMCSDLLTDANSRPPMYPVTARLPTLASFSVHHHHRSPAASPNHVCSSRPSSRSRNRR